MMKKFISLIICAALLSFCLSPVAWADGGDVVKISTADELTALIESCVSDSYSIGKTFLLENDINMTGLRFSSVPLMGGVFDGQGHSITGVNFDSSGSAQGLFRMVLSSGEVKDLNVTGKISASGTAENIGGIAGINYGKITGCSFDGNVSGVSAVGGIAGKNCEGAVISDCSVSGTLNGQHRVGGIAGENDGSILSCANAAAVNTEYIPVEQDTSFDISIISLSEEDIIDITDLGGIAGLNLSVISECENSGNVGYQHTGYNVGGIAGRQSGQIALCENSGIITGRKDVGGIVGQIEPYTVWNFTGSGLLELQSQLYGLESMMNGMLSDAGASQTNVSFVLSEALSVLASSGDIIGRMFSTPDSGTSPDAGTDSETGGAALPDISSPSNWVDSNRENVEALSQNFQQLTSLISALPSSLGTEQLVADMQGVLGQLMNVSSSLMSMMYSVGNEPSVEDVSESADSGRARCLVSQCVNRADIAADTNSGGVVGSVALDISFDREDSLDLSSLVFGNGKYEIFAKISGCESYGEIRADKNCAGGIVGRMDYGAAVECSAAGDVSAAESYAGGVAGYSSAAIRRSYARANLSAASYVGGIAGIGKNISDCRAMPHIEEAVEFNGSIAGYADGTLSGNLYSECSIGGVDGFSFSGQTDEMDYESFAALDNTPESFKKITVTFMTEGETVETVEVELGGAVKKLPDVPDKDGMYWQWDEFDNSGIYYSLTVEGEYVRPVTTIGSGGDEPLFLVEGVFREGQTLKAENFALDCAAVGIDETRLLAAYTVMVPDYDDALTVRMLAEENGALYTLSPDGALNSLSYSRDGSYIVFKLDNGASIIYLAAEKSDALPAALGAAGAAAAAAAAVLFVKKKKRRAAEANNEDGGHGE